jgi:transcriptional regulator with XRE-family HTH domain
MDLGLRQSDVAKRLGVWTSTVNYWENKHFHPEVQYVPKIVAFFPPFPLGHSAGMDTYLGSELPPGETGSNPRCLELQRNSSREP